MPQNLNTTIKETKPSCCPETNWKQTFVYYLFFIVSLTGNTVIGIIVYKTKTMRKPINFFIANMAMCDLLFPFFVIPSLLLMLYTDVWMHDRWSSWPALAWPSVS